MNPSTKTITLTGSCFLMATAAAMAQFGLPTIVADPGAYARLAAETAQIAQEYNEIVNLYQTSQMAYANLQNAATFITNKSAWMPTATTWQTPYIQNTYGNTAGWSTAITTGNGSVAGYSAVTSPIQPYGQVLNTYNPATQSTLSNQYGLMQIITASGENAIAQSGAVRAASMSNQQALSRLAADSASTNPKMNTQVGVLNQMNAAAVFSANQQTQSAQLLAASLDLQAAESAARRERQVAEINDQIQFRSSYAALNNSRTIGTSNALQSFRP